MSKVIVQFRKKYMNREGKYEWTCLKNGDNPAVFDIIEGKYQFLRLKNRGYNVRLLKL